jgi:dTMP kinase
MSTGIDEDPTMPQNRGLLVIFEGIDFSGKSTQAQLLVDSLMERGIPVERISFPFYESLTGALLRDYLRSTTDLDPHVAHLLFSANRWEQIEKMENLIRGGTTIVCDRYCYSGIAYTVAKGVPFEWAQHPDEDLLVPDVQFYLQISPSEAAERSQQAVQEGKRAAFGEGDRHEKLDFLEKVSTVYWETLVNEEEWEIIEAILPTDQIAQTVLQTVTQATEKLRAKK